MAGGAAGDVAEGTAALQPAAAVGVAEGEAALRSAAAVRASASPRPAGLRREAAPCAGRGRGPGRGGTSADGRGRVAVANAGGDATERTRDRRAEPGGDRAGGAACHWRATDQHRGTAARDSRSSAPWESR